MHAAAGAGVSAASPQDACVLTVPSSRQGIHPSSFNASETFTAFRLIRDVLTFFVWGFWLLKLLLPFHWGV